MKPIIVHSEAEEEVRTSMAYYEEQRAGLDRDFESDLKSAFARIQRNPEAFVLYDDRGTRECLLNRFPFTVYFEEMDDAIWVKAVAHQSRRPGYWTRRALE